MQEIDFETIKTRSLSGILALTSRTFLLQLVSFGSTFILTILLTPQIFGVFYVVSAVISFLSYFSDIGLAAALIQKKTSLTQDDLKTTFTIQQTLVVCASLIAFISTPMIVNFYGLDRSGRDLYIALIVAFFLSSLKTIPSIILERKLQFGRLVIPQILETSVFYTIAIFFAWQGKGIASFAYAVVGRAIIGLISLYIISPWKPIFGVSRHVARDLLKFGVPFQLNSFLALVKDDLLTVFLGKALPFAAVGYIGWAKKWSEIPLRLILDSVIRVSFPAFSRIQHSRVLLGKAINKTLFGLSISMFPISAGLIFFVQPMIESIPKYSKWEPALLSFYLFAVASSLSGLSVPLTNTLNAIGKIQVTLKLMVMWTVLTWVGTVMGIRILGYNGVAAAFLIITVTIGIVIALVKKEADFSFVAAVTPACIGVLVQSLFYALLLNSIPRQLPYLIGLASAGVILYAWVVFSLRRNELSNLINSFRIKS